MVDCTIKYVGINYKLIINSGLIWCEIRALWTGGLREYTADLWNIVDFITNMFYLMWISLRFSSWYIVNVRVIKT